MKESGIKWYIRIFKWVSRLIVQKEVTGLMKLDKDLCRIIKLDECKKKSLFLSQIYKEYSNGYRIKLAFESGIDRMKCIGKINYYEKMSLENYQKFVTQP